MQEFLKRADFGSPKPAVEIMLGFQKSNTRGLDTQRDASPLGTKKHKLKEDPVPLETLLSIDSPMKLSVYKKMAFEIFQALLVI